MRITVYDVRDYLASGMRIEDVLRDFPYLTRKDIHPGCACAPSGNRCASAPYTEIKALTFFANFASLR